MAKYKPVVLVVLDGWGYSEEKEGNPLLSVDLPTIKKIDEKYPGTLLQASGLSVGLPWMQMGNSEVGHQVLGTGQIIFHNLPLINSAIANDSFFQNPVFKKACDLVKKNNTRLHLVGLVSDGQIHSHIDHLLAFLEAATQEGVIEQTFVHAITDGRDTPPQVAPDFLRQIIDFPGGKIATIVGRYYTMDRNENWDRVEKGFLAMTEGEGINTVNPFSEVEKQHQKGLSDEYLEPIVVTEENGTPIGSIRDGDAVIFFNFRKDRARQVAKAFTSPDFSFFKKAKQPNILFCSITQYDESITENILFPTPETKYRLSQIIAEAGKKQLKLAETEKYAHVTYFFNGGEEKPFPNEDQVLIPSKNAPSYAEVPEMSSLEITAKLEEALSLGKYDFILVNYASPDMVGHTGNFIASQKAVQVIDQCLASLIPSVLSRNGCLIITADHGNVEEMINLKTGEIDTQHSSNPVPCWIITPDNHLTTDPLEPVKKETRGILADVMPTILDLMEIPRPNDLIGKNILEILKDKGGSF